MLIESPLSAGRGIAQVGLDLVLGRYPSAVYGRELARGEMPPVFVFHSVRAEPFERLLRLLAENGYRTLTCDEYLEWMRDGVPPEGRRSLLLTFDDGMGQVWSVAWPLLRRYGLTAVVFLIPSVVTDGPADGAVGPTLDDVEAGSVSLAEVESRDRTEEPLATWSEIRRMHESGVVDFQSHTMNHELVFVGDRIRGYVHPGLVRSVHPNRLTLWEERRSRYRVVPPLGAPIYPAAPRMGEAPRVQEDPELRRACLDHVAERGGAAFFDRPAWQRELDRLVRAHRSTRGRTETRESASERAAAIAADLAESKRQIEERLPGKTVRHLAYPWGIGSRTAGEIAREVGYASAHWGRAEHGPTNRVGGDPFRIARIGEDFLPLLPGRGRSTLAGVVRKKLAKNLRRLSA